MVMYRDRLGDKLGEVKAGAAIPIELADSILAGARLCMIKSGSGGTVKMAFQHDDGEVLLVSCGGEGKEGVVVFAKQ